MARTSPAARKKIGDVMHEFSEGTLKSGSGRKVTSKKQALAIGYSEARERGMKAPAKATKAKTRKSTTSRKTAKHRAS